MPEIALVDLLVLGAAIGLAYAVGSQVLIPIVLGRPLFPFLRARRQLERELAEMKEQLEQIRLERELEELKRKVDAARMPPELYEIIHGNSGDKGASK
jgi:hypothetical protein